MPVFYECPLFSTTSYNLMKRFPLLRYGVLLATLWGLAYCKSNDVMPDVVIEKQDTLSIAGLRALTAHSVPSSVRITDAGKEGVFTLLPADRTTPDDLGLTLVTAKGWRYRRMFSGPASAGWFGVDASATDIGPALQAAVNAVAQVTIPDGNYTQRTPVKLRSGLTIAGNPGKVVITLPETYVSLLSLATVSDAIIPLENVVIDGLSWQVTSRQTGTFGTIYIDGPVVNNLTVQNCTSTDVAAKDTTNWLTVKIQAGKTAKNILVRNNTIQAKRMACEIFNHDNIGIYAGKDITVSNNNFHDCYFGLSLSGPLEGLTVTGNRIKNCGFYGIEIAGAARSVVITGNQFEGVFDRFLAGSNDGNGNGSITGGMIVSGNTTLGTCTGGIILANGGAVQFTKNTFSMTGLLEITHSTNGGTFSDNTIDSGANKAIICDNTHDNTFTNNIISNKNNPENQATFLSYGTGAVNNTLTNNRFFKGRNGKYIDGISGGSYKASMNYDEAGNVIP